MTESSISELHKFGPFWENCSINMGIEKGWKDGNVTESSVSELQKLVPFGVKLLSEYEEERMKHVRKYEKWRWNNLFNIAVGP